MIVLKVEGGPASQNPRCNLMERLDMKVVAVLSKLLTDASFLPSHPPIKAMQPVGNVAQLAYLRTNK